MFELGLCLSLRSEDDILKELEELSLETQGGKAKVTPPEAQKRLFFLSVKRFQTGEDVHLKFSFILRFFLMLDT